MLNDFVTGKLEIKRAKILTANQIIEELVANAH
jgi:hypothetical protein